MCLIGTQYENLLQVIRHVQGSDIPSGRSYDTVSIWGR